MLSLLGTGIKLVSNSIDETRDVLSGEQSGLIRWTDEKDRTEKFYYTFKLFPGLNALTKAVELFPQQKYERF